MLCTIVPDSRFLSRFALLLLVASPTTLAHGAVEESLSTLHTYTPAIRNDPSPFHCTDCWELKPDQRPSLPQHQSQRYRRGHHERGLRPHKNPFAKKSHSFSRGMRSLPRHALSMGGFERNVESWQVRTVDGDTIRYGTDRTTRWRPAPLAAVLPSSDTEAQTCDFQRGSAMRLNEYA